MHAVLQRIVALRQKVSPRSSYATSGAVASTFVVVGADEDVSLEWGDGLLQTGEFDKFVYVSGALDAVRADKDVRGNVLVFVNPTLEEVHLAGRLIDQRKTNLVFMVVVGEGKEGTVAGARALASGGRQVVVDEFPPHEWLATVCVNRGNGNGGSSSSSSSNSSGNGQAALGFNHQPSVQSRQQFRYLWDGAAKAAAGPTAAAQRGIYAAPHGSAALAPAVDAKLRVLQRLADKEMHDKTKWSADVWDNHIATALGVGFDDYAIYNSLRERFTGKSLDDALRLEGHEAAAAEALEEGEEGPEPKEEAAAAAAGPPVLAGAHGGGEEGDNPDGRAQYMVDMTVECLPEALARPGQVIARPGRRAQPSRPGRPNPSHTNPCSTVQTQRNALRLPGPIPAGLRVRRRRHHGAPSPPPAGAPY